MEKILLICRSSVARRFKCLHISYQFYFIVFFICILDMPRSSSTNDEDAAILSYHDSLLTKGDLRLLDEGNWLNDKLIAFYFE